MQTQQPVAFEIQIEKKADAAPPVKIRLEQSPGRKAITLDLIKTKLEQANKARQDRVEKQISVLVTKNEAKVKFIKEREEAEERAHKEKLAKKLTAAEEKRTVQISSIQDKARTHNERVVKAIDALNDKENQQVENRRT